MPGKEFQASARRIANDTNAVAIDMRGELNRHCQAALDAAFAEVVRYQPDTVLLNMAGVDRISSEAIAQMIVLLIRARKAGLHLAVYGFSPHGEEVFRLTGLDELIDVFPDEASALGAAQPAGTDIRANAGKGAD